jgi:copper chaperone CopZ
MKQTYTIKGMTCGGCKTSVEKHIGGVEFVTNVEVSLEMEEVTITLEHPISIDIFKKVLPEKFNLFEKSYKSRIQDISSISEKEQEVSKVKQLQPLFIILFYLATTVIFLNYKDWNPREMMFDFMGLFFIVFSFFKMLDLKNFPTSFSMYDPLAEKILFYGWVYPFIEIALGLMFLVRFELNIALYVTIVILGITTFGVTKTLMNKKNIQCACLGTALKLPMTEATLIENALMLSMSIFLVLTW